MSYRNIRYYRNRKIAGVLYEQNLGAIAHRVHDLVDTYKTTKTGQKKIMPLVSKYYPRYANMSVEDFINLHESNPIEEVYYFNVGCYSNIKPEEIETWMDELGLESQSEILMPTDQLTDLDELKNNLDPAEYEKVVKDMDGKFTKVDKKLQCGWMTLEELYHIPSYSSKVTTSLYGVAGPGGVNYRRDEPILGRGKYRVTGQQIGEDELSALLARNTKTYINSVRKENAKEDNQLFLNNLLGLGLTITDDKGYNQGGSDLKNRVNKFKNKFRPKI